MLADRLAEKLEISGNSHICVLEAPVDFTDAFEAQLPVGARVTDYIGLRGFDAVLWWPTSIIGLEARLAKLAYCIKPAGSIWLVIPKWQYVEARDITFSWAEMQAIALQSDMVDNKTVSLSQTDYATRFVIRSQHRFKYQ